MGILYFYITFLEIFLYALIGLSCRERMLRLFFSVCQLPLGASIFFPHHLCSYKNQPQRGKIGEKKESKIIVSKQNERSAKPVRMRNNSWEEEEKGKQQQLSK